MKYIRFICRVIVGMVFIFSGFVKVVDPLGSAYKFADYFHAFGIGFLEFAALPLGIFLATFEGVLGVILILGYRRRIVFLVLMWFVGFFTLLTFVLAIFNPVSDCGCFGDALILTNWQTFLKNLVLMGFVLLLYLNRKREDESGKRMGEWVVAGGLFVMALCFSLWNYRHLPLIDFRPFDVGSVIAEKMEIPEGAPQDQYETTLIYKNKETGKSKSFTMENYPKDTLLWEFESSDSKLIKKGYEAPIHDFAITDKGGRNLAEKILEDKGYSLLMIGYDLTKSDPIALQNATGWSQLEVLADDFTFYAVSATPTSQVKSVSSAYNLGYGFYAADEIMLKTMIRSNPGFVLLKNGIILGKWGYRDFPAIEDLDPEWSELVGNASAPVDEETQMLMEAGVYEDFSFNVVDFDRFLPELLFKQRARVLERRAILLFIMGILLLIFLSQFLSKTKV